MGPLFGPLFGHLLPMSQSQNQKAIKALEASLERAEASLQAFRDGERFWRSWERSKQYVAAARRAKSYLELALESLEDPLAGTEFGVARRGWLGRTVKGLASYLSHGAQEGADQDSLDAVGAPLPTESLSDQWSESGPGQALEGNGAVVELPDLIGMIRAQGMTGILNLTLPIESLQLHFEAGNLVHAYSENAPANLRLGEILVEQGAIEEERLNSLLYCHRSSPKLLGEILISGGVVDSEDLHKALNYQIQCLFDRLFTYRKQAHFRFEPGLPDTTAHRARVNVLQLLLESARAYDETEQSAVEEVKKEAS